MNSFAREIRIIPIFFAIASPAIQAEKVQRIVLAMMFASYLSAGAQSLASSFWISFCGNDPRPQDKRDDQ